MEQVEELAGKLFPRGIIPGRYIQMGEHPARVAVPSTEPGCEPLVELIRENDVVQAIEVTCTCGKRIRLQCQY